MHFEMRCKIKTMTDHHILFFLPQISNISRIHLSQKCKE